jgi:hypothetical protein
LTNFLPNKVQHIAENQPEITPHEAVTETLKDLLAILFPPLVLSPYHYRLFSLMITLKLMHKTSVDKYIIQ